MSPATSRRTLGLADDFYAPEFVVDIEGTPLAAKLKGDVREIKVVLDLADLASVDLTLSNVDQGAYAREEAAAGRLAPGAFGPPVLTSELTYSDVFRLHSRVHVKLGYADRLVSVMRGEIQTLVADFPSADAPTLTVRALDALVAMKDKFPPKGTAYAKLADWEIVKAVVERDHQLEFKIDPADMKGPIHEKVEQEGKDDLTFAKDRAKKIGFDLASRIDPSTGKTVVVLAEPADGRGAKGVTTYVLAWGSLHGAGAGNVPPSLISFKPTISTAQLVNSVTVRGWNPDTKKPIEVRAILLSDVPGKEKEAIAGSKNIVVTDLAVANAEQAMARADALLKDREHTFFTASAKAIGLPDLTPGDNVEIHGVGSRFNGRYFVTKVTHTLNDKGFVTDFDVRKAVGTDPA